jgi:cell fate regulator YaaT (PSP1 superfamily)
MVNRMAEIVGIKFRNMGKLYYFDPDGHKFARGEMAIVETTYGLECGEVVVPNREVKDEDIVKPLKKVIRPAQPEDIKRLKENMEKEKRAFDICLEKIAAHKLAMKLVNVEYTFDNSKILFYFTADGRVDFRELVKDLASVFRTRIELRQIGVRDEAKMLGGIGICGLPFCCTRFLNDFEPVSIRMAKEQGMSLNPTKISGSCGRLMCCLKYEQEIYDELLKTTPKVGAIVNTKEGRGTVLEVNLLTGNLKVVLDKAPESPPVSVHVRDVTVIRDSQIKIEEEEAEELLGLEDD